MTLKCGIVGLPNVGKSTLFNAITASNKAAAANYPFCTIEPNSAIVSVPDERLEKLASLAGSAKIISAHIEFVDIAGLVKGASKGEGLGNKFLANIREVDAIIHVVRCFEDPDVVHVNGSIDPASDIETIETELQLADLDSLEKRLTSSKKKLKNDDKILKAQIQIMEEALKFLEEGKSPYQLLKSYNAKELKFLELLTLKPLLYVCNVDEESAKLGNKYSKIVQEKVAEQGARTVVISSKIESEIALLESWEEKNEFLAELGLSETGLSKIIEASYNLLNLKSFFTIGPKEAHAWTFKNGALAPEAAGIIHTDFEKGFIRAEIISYADYINCKSEAKAKEVGKMRLEGKEYIMQDGDVVHFRFNV
jgi:ribosome-binding ATPase